MRRRTNHSGFTLIELVLVMLLISITLATTVPSLKGWSRGSKLREAGDQFLAVTRYARTQAASDGRTYRLNIDPQSGGYVLSVQDGMQFVPLGNEFGRNYALPAGYMMSVTDEQNQPLSVIDFFPNGRTYAAQVRIAAGPNDFVDIQCPSPAEGFRLALAQEVMR